MDATRTHDFKVIEKGLRASDPNERRQAQIAEAKLKDQSHDGWLAEARNKLLRESRAGRKDNATDIRDELVKHKNMGIGKTSFGIEWADGQYERIFGHE